MAEYIDREAAQSIVLRLRDKCDNDEMAFALNWAIRLIQGIPAADVVERPRWIPVDERLPDDDGRVLTVYTIVSGRKYYGINSYLHDPDEMHWEFPSNNVTHWMTLPLAPEDGNNG